MDVFKNSIPSPEKFDSEHMIKESDKHFGSGTNGSLGGMSEKDLKAGGTQEDLYEVARESGSIGPIISIWRL